MTSTFHGWVYHSIVISNDNSIQTHKTSTIHEFSILLMHFKDHIKSFGRTKGSNYYYDGMSSWSLATPGPSPPPHLLAGPSESKNTSPRLTKRDLDTEGWQWSFPWPPHVTLSNNNGGGWCLWRDLWSFRRSHLFFYSLLLPCPVQCDFSPYVSQKWLVTDGHSYSMYSRKNAGLLHWETQLGPAWKG